MFEHDLENIGRLPAGFVTAPAQAVDSKANPNFGFCENARPLESPTLHKPVETPQVVDSKAERKIALCESADPKEYTALAHDAAGFAAHSHDAAASLATLFQAIARLAGANQLVRELAEIGEAKADELSEAAEDTRARYMLEADRIMAPPAQDQRG